MREDGTETKDKEQMEENEVLEVLCIIAVVVAAGYSVVKSRERIAASRDAGRGKWYTF